MESYTIEIEKDELVFCAAHFITYGGGRCETLHGHNYRVGARLGGPLDANGLVHDFIDVRDRLFEIVGRLDHRTLLPETNPHFQLEHDGDDVELRYRDRTYRFPAADVVVLPVSNTTAELLARHLADQLLDQLTSDDVAGTLSELEIEVEESFGQSATFRRELSPE